LPVVGWSIAPIGQPFGFAQDRLHDPGFWVRTRNSSLVPFLGLLGRARSRHFSQGRFQVFHAFASRAFPSRFLGICALIALSLPHPFYLDFLGLGLFQRFL